MDIVKKEDLQGNYTPIKSIIYAFQKVQKNELSLDFWGNFFLNGVAFLGMTIIMVGGLEILMAILASLAKLGEAFL